MRSSVKSRISITPSKIAIALVLLGFLWISITSVIAGVTRKMRPDIAIQFRPADAMAHAQLASRLQLTDYAQDHPETVRRIALFALARDPTLAEATRALGLMSAQEGDMEAASRLMRYADGVTRRDLATQLWLIEQKLRQGDISGMLRHFEAAASTSTSGTSVLFPLMASALDDPAMVEPLAAMLEKEPRWAPSLLRTFADNTASTENVGTLFIELAERGHPVRADIAAVVIERLSKEGKTRQATRLRQLTRESAPPPPPTPDIID